MSRTLGERKKFELEMGFFKPFSSIDTGRVPKRENFRYLSGLTLSGSPNFSGNILTFRRLLEGRAF